MKLRVALSVLLIGFSGCTLAAQNPQPPSALSVLLYLPLMDDANWSGMMANAQLTITPRSTYAVRAIQTQNWNSNNGSCTDLYDTSTIDNGAGNVVTLIAGHSYRTTDASNYAYQHVTAFSTGFDETFQLLDNNLNPIGTPACIAGNATVPDSCPSVNQCGWATPQTWTP